MGARERTHVLVAAIALAIGASVALSVYRASAAFGPMYADFGGGPLPWPTQILLAWWAPASSGALAASPAILALVRPKTRFLALAMSAALAFLAFALALWAAYAPIWELAGNITAE